MWGAARRTSGIERVLAELLLRPVDELGPRAARFHPLVARPRGPTGGRPTAGLEIGREELRPQRAEQLAIEPAAVLEADLLLGGMDVDVDHLRRHVEPQEADRLGGGGRGGGGGRTPRGLAGGGA